MYREVFLQFTDLFVLAYIWLMIARIVISFVAPQSDNFLCKWVYELTEPILGPIRKFATIGPLDLSPIVVFLGLQIVQRAVYYLLQ